MKTRLSIVYCIGSLLLGILIIGIFFAIQTNTINTYNDNLPYISLGDNLKNKTTKGHLWFEEYMAGDESIDFKNDVLVLFQNSREILKAAINGDSTELGNFYPTDDRQIHTYINKIIAELDDLIEVTNKRKEFKEKLDYQLLMAQQDSSAVVSRTGEEAGGVLDQVFDEAYENVQASLDELILYINKGVKEDVSFLNILTYLVVFFILIIFIALGIIVYRIQNKNELVAAESESRLTEETERINKMTKFVGSIIEGDYKNTLELDNKEDKLAQSLIAMKENLQKVSNDEKRRYWVNEGLRQLNNIIRKSHHHINDQYDQIIKFVIEYTNSNQGGIFIFDEEVNVAELVACYAYDRKKYLNKTIERGEGLVGQCLLEKETIYLIDIPNEYVSITSGLGKANPNALAIVPLKVNDEIFGAIEMATFRPYEEHELQLIETMAEVIASTVSSIQSNEQTKTLLEQAQQQAEEMRAQEEEMRQNMEELSATQEEMARKEKEYVQTINDLQEELLQTNAELTTNQE